MAKEKIRHLPVTGAGGALAGIVTDRDIGLNLPSRATSLSAGEMAPRRGPIKAPAGPGLCLCGQGSEAARSGLACPGASAFASLFAGQAIG